jgi:hypothetical protein
MRLIDALFDVPACTPAPCEPRGASTCVPGLRFRERFKRGPVKRAKRGGLLRNAAAASERLNDPQAAATQEPPPAYDAGAPARGVI